MNNILPTLRNDPRTISWLQFEYHYNTSAGSFSERYKYFAWVVDCPGKDDIIEEGFDVVVDEKHPVFLNFLEGIFDCLKNLQYFECRDCAVEFYRQ